MTKDVVLTLRGLQLDPQGEESSVETVTAAEYYNRNNSHYILYEDPAEGPEEVTRNRIRLGKDSLELTKRGAVNARMIFEENKKTGTDYSTPFGDIRLDIEAHEIRVREEEDRIRVDVGYALEVNYEYLADCRLSMEIQSR